MDIKVTLLFFVVGFLSLVNILAQSVGVKEHRTEDVSVLFEIKLIKYELMSLATTMNSLENKFHQHLNNIEERMVTLEARCMDNTGYC